MIDRKSNLTKLQKFYFLLLYSIIYFIKLFLNFTLRILFENSPKIFPRVYEQKKYEMLIISGSDQDSPYLKDKDSLQ